MNRRKCGWVLVLGMLIATTGCSGGTPAPSAAGKQFLLNAEPAGAIGVGEARQPTSKDGEVVIVGRIGGSEKPFIEGMAAFTIVDPKVPYCGKDEGCPTPWDYCCEQNLVKENIATVKFVDASGKPIMQSARELLGVKELAMVVVRGDAKRSDDGNLSVVAKQVFIRP